MSAILPINLEDLLHCRGVESERVEFKATWDATTGPQVLRTLCAYANDFHNLNGGYVVIGVRERAGRAELPPVGLSSSALAAAQKWIRGNCGRLDPPYAPIFSPERIGDRHVLAVWAPASDMRPHRVPEAKGGPGQFWIRLGAETVDAERRGDFARRLIEQTARVPWDDRLARDVPVEALRATRVREFLRDVGSGLLAEPDDREIYRRMRLTARLNDHEAPRNAALLLFADNPSDWFRGAKIELARFAADRGGDVQEEQTFSGGMIDQLRACLQRLESTIVLHIRKRADRPEALRWTSYPVVALREALVNAVYHRGYDVDQPEPTKVYVYPSRIEIVSYPGPVPGVEREDFAPAAAFLRAAPARNRRIGEFLKEVRLAEGRLSGLPKIFEAMAANGSPPPVFRFDEQRMFFQATLPAHPEYVAVSALRDAAQLRAVGDTAAARRRIESALATNARSKHAPALRRELQTLGRNDRTGIDAGD